MRSPYRPMIVALVLLLIAASRILRLSGLELDHDEVWTIWQTFGTPRQILAWTPYDWPPLHFLALGLWKELVGIHPVAVRVHSILVLLPGLAFLYRAMRRDHGHSAGLLAVLTYAALAFVVYASVVIRGHVLVLALLPAALWLTQRYFYRSTPARGVLLGLCMAAMFYSHLTSVMAFAMLGLYTLLVTPSAIWRWWLPGLAAGILALPEIARKIEVATSGSRFEALQEADLPPMPEAWADLFFAATGELAALWAVLLVGVSVTLLARRRLQRPAAVWLAWFALGALVLYVANPVLGFFRIRYGMSLLLGLAAWIGLGLALLPGAVQGVAVGVLVVSMFFPLPIKDLHEGIPTPPMTMIFDWLREEMRWGDVIVVDPSVAAPPETWDYYTRVYFPHGLTYVSDPAGYRRVWYATVVSWEDPTLAAAVREGRVAGRFVGPWDLLVRLYEAPPNPEGILYENGMRFHGAEITRPATAPHQAVAYREGETVRLRLWWSVSDAVPMDYSVGLHLLSPDGRLLMQSDSAPHVLDGPAETSQWRAGNYYIEERTIRLPSALYTGTFSLNLVVYQWWDNERVMAGGVDENGMLLLESLPVKAW